MVATTLRFDTPRPDRRTPTADDPDQFDLGRRDHYDLVRKLYFGRFSARVRAAGIDPEDGLQLVFEGLVRKSQSERSRWDPTRGSLSTWIFVAVSGLTINLAQKQRRRPTLDLGGESDVASWTHLPAPECEEEPPVVEGGTVAFEAGIVGR